MNTAYAIVCIALALLAYATFVIAAERAVYSALNRPAEPTRLALTLVRWSRCGATDSTDAPDGLGWLGRLCSTMTPEPATLLRKSLEARAAAARWQMFLPMAANLAVSAGLLGTVLGMQHAGRGGSAASAVGMGMTTTAAGVGIGLLAGFTHLMTRSRTRLLIEQAEDIADAADALLRTESTTKPAARNIAADEDETPFGGVS